MFYYVLVFTPLKTILLNACSCYPIFFFFFLGSFNILEEAICNVFECLLSGLWGLSKDIQTSGFSLTFYLSSDITMDTKGMSSLLCVLTSWLSERFKNTVTVFPALSPQSCDTSYKTHAVFLWLAAIWPSTDEAEGLLRNVWFFPRRRYSKPSVFEDSTQLAPGQRFWSLSPLSWVVMRWPSQLKKLAERQLL